MEQRIARVEDIVHEHESRIAVIDDRQARMHEDLDKLTKAIKANTEAQSEFNSFISNKRGFIAGVIATLSVLSGLLGALLVLAWEKFTAL